MPRKETIQVELAAPNRNLSPATKFGNLLFVAGQTGRHPTTGEGQERIATPTERSASDTIVWRQ